MFAPRKRRGPTVLRALVLPVVLLAACAGQAPSSTTPAAATPVVTASSAPTLTPVPGSIAPSALPAISDDPGAPFEPPTPVCPAPAVAVEAPRLLAASGSASVLMDEGSSGVTTCSTSSSTDVIPVDPTNPLHVAAGEFIHVTLPPGWHFLYWESWDRAPETEGANVTPGGRTPDRPTAIDVPAPIRIGRSILGVTAWVITTDGRAVSGIEGTVLVER